MRKVLARLFSVKNMPAELIPSLKLQGWQKKPLGEKKVALHKFKNALNQDTHLQELMVQSLHLCKEDARYQKNEAVRVLEEMVSVCPGLSFFNGKTMRETVGQIYVDPSKIDVMTDIISVLTPASISGSGTLILASSKTYFITSHLLHLLQFSINEKIAGQFYPLKDEMFNSQMMGFFYCMQSRQSSRKIYKKLASSNDCMAECFFSISGSNPVYFREDAQPAHLQKVLRQAIRLAGQSTRLPKRLIFHRARKDLLEKAKQWLQNIKVGDLKDIQSTLSSPIDGMTESIVEIKKVAQQQKLPLQGGQTQQLGERSFIKPIFITDCRKSSLWNSDYLHGPVILADLVDNDDQAVQAMEGAFTNSWAAIFTHHTQSAVEMAGKVSAGQVLINTVEEGFDLPMGGRRRGGKGNLYGQDAYNNTVMCKSIFK